MLLASVSASAGELDGKAILCDRDDRPDVYGFEFRNGKSLMSYVKTDADRFVASLHHWEEWGADPYAAKAKTLEWGFYSLDRKTLILTGSEGSQLSPKFFTASCEVSPSVGAMKQAMEMHRQDMQRQIDERMKDNKI